MKKRFLSFMLTMTIILSLIPAFSVPVNAGKALQHVHDGGTFIPVYQEDLTDGFLSDGAIKSGYYVLSEDITLTKSLEIYNGENVVICLNGKTLIPGDYSIIVGISANLLITDCKHDSNDLNVGGCIASGTDLTTPIIENHGDLLVSGVAFCNNHRTVIKNDSTSGASILNSVFVDNSSNERGGAVSSINGSIYIKDSYFSGNSTADRGGAIYHGKGNLTLINTTIENNTAGISGGGVYISKRGCCVIEGTKITMADGSYKNAEDIKLGDEVKAFDHETGELTESTICYIYKGEEKDRALKLYFTNGISLGIHGEHGLLEKETRQYVNISRGNVNEYIGKYFYNAEDARWEELLGAEDIDEVCNFYALYTSQTINCLTEKMLSVAEDSLYQVNIFSKDEDLRFNQEEKQHDIEVYGLRSFEDSIAPDMQTYIDYNYKYSEIFLGKDLITIEEINALIEEYEEEKAAENAAVEKNAEKPALLSRIAKAFLPVPVYADSTPLYNAYAIEGYTLVNLGDNVIVKNNTAAGITDNIYLEDNTFINLVGDPETISTGITLEQETGKFTVTTAALFAGHDTKDAFFSDNENYTVRYNNGQYLEIFTAYFDDRFSKEVNGNTYTAGNKYTVYGDVKYTFEGWSTAIDDIENITDEFECGKTYYAVWSNKGNIVVTTPLVFEVSNPSSALPTGSGITWDEESLMLKFENSTIDTYTSAAVNAKVVDIIIPQESQTPASIEFAGENHIYFRNTSAEEAADSTIGISANSGIVVTGSGMIDIKAGQFGIYADGDIEIRSGSISAIVTGTASDDIAINSLHGDIKISGNETYVYAESILGSSSYNDEIGINSCQGSVIINGANVIARGSDMGVRAKSTGLYSPEYHIYVTNAALRLNGDADGLGTNKTFTISASGLVDSILFNAHYYETSGKMVCYVGEDESNLYPSVYLAVNSAEANTETKVTLISDVSELVSIPEDKNIILDLNGHLLRAVCGSWTMDNYGTLTLTDSNKGNISHNYKVSGSGLWVLTDETANAVAYESLNARPAAGTIVTVKGGAVTACDDFACGYASSYYTPITNYKDMTISGASVIGNKGELKGIIRNYDSDSTITFVSGLVAGNLAEQGAGFFTATGKVIMKGGAISFNTAVANGGAVDCSIGTFHMYGGLMSYNKANYGGAVYNGSSFSSFHMHGGAIRFNQAGYDGGGVYDTRNDCSFEGLCVVTDNTVNGKQSNICVQGSIGINDGIDKSVATAVSQGSILGITRAYGEGQFTWDDQGNASDAAYFVSDDDTYMVQYNENGHYLELVKAPVCVITSGGSLTGNKYETLADALSDIGNTPCRIKLLKDIKEQVTIWTEQDVIFELNDHKLGDHIQKNGTNGTLTFVIKSETDMYNAINVPPANMRQVWEIESDITISRFVKITNRYLTINGNGHTIKGAAGKGEADKTLQMFAIDSVKAASKNNIKINNLKIVCSERFKNAIAVQNKDELRNGIKLVLTDVEIDHSLNNGGAAILNFGSTIIAKGRFKLTTGENSCYAVGMDLAATGAGFIFDDEAEVTITDNRNPLQKAERALIFISSRNSGNTASVTGQYVDTMLLPAGNTGYNPVTQIHFNAMGGTAVASSTTAAYWLISKPETTRSGFSFGGWYSDTRYTNAWNFEDDKITPDMTLYAKWIADSVSKASINGKVTDDNQPVQYVEGAIVELMLGTGKVAATATDINGCYTFDNVENETYNIIVRNSEKTKTAMVEVVSDGSISIPDIVLPLKDVSSKVEYTGSSSENSRTNAEGIIVGGVDSIAEAQTPGTNRIEIVLTVEPKANDSSDNTQAEIKNVAQGRKLEFLDFTLTKQINDQTPSDIGNSNTQLLTIVVPFDTQTVIRDSITVYRYHGSTAQAFTRITDEAFKADGTFMVCDDSIVIYAVKFSTYAVGYRIEGSNDDSGNYYDYDDEPAVPAPKKLCPQDETCVYAVFPDANTKAWYHSGVHFCVENKYMNGYDNKLFGPEDYLSRGMIVQILYNMENCPKPDKKSSFTDVSASSWYSDAIAWAEENNVVDGYGNGLFGPKDNVTREQLAKILMGYAKYKNYDVSAVEELTVFEDGDKTSRWAVPSLKWATAVKLVNGYPDGTIKSRGFATRAEAATMIQNFCEKVKP